MADQKGGEKAKSDDKKIKSGELGEDYIKYHAFSVAEDLPLRSPKIGYNYLPIGGLNMEMPQPNSEILSKKAKIAAALRAVLPYDAVIDDPSETRAYECDALTAYRCPPMIAVLPATTQEVSDILKICHREGVPVVPRGSGTSLAGNLSVSGAVEEEDFFYAPDPSSQLACAIAGNIAMNSGGAHCLKYGVTTNNLMGVTMVMMDGEIVEIGGGYLDASGLDILGVICGSEGQLGVVTEATLRILPKPEGARPVMIAFDSNEVAGACVADIIKAGVLPVAIEFMDRPIIEICENFAKAGYPDCEALLIVEVEGSEAEIQDQLDRISAIAQQHNPVELRQSQSAAESAAIWLGRKSAFGAVGQVADYMCLDGTIPVSALPEVLRRIKELSDHYGLRVGNVFHAGDGNMHPLIMFDANKEGDLELCEAMGADVLRLCVEVGGCLTGEHGVGIEKRDLMEDQYSAEDLEIQMAVKDVFDPAWLLNPSKVFPLSVSQSRRAS